VNEFKYPSWQQPLQAAIDEADPQKVPEKLSSAEDAIFLRLQELNDSHEDPKESAALRLACKEILRIQILRLNWPATDGMLSSCAE
jgi:hypothetical protein